MKETILLNSVFYQALAIEKSIQDFKDVAKIEFLRNGKYFEVKITSKKNVPNLKEEFINYAFGITRTNTA